MTGLSSAAVRWLRRPWVWLLVTGVVAGVAVVALRHAPALQLERVSVVGNHQVSADEVLQAAQVRVGDPLVDLPLDSIEHRVEALDAVAAADATRQWPDGIRIEIRERRSVGYLRVATNASLVGSDASIFRELETIPTDLPELVGLTGVSSGSVLEGADASAAAVFAVADSLPRPLQRAVARVEADRPRQVRLVFDDGVVVTWGGPAEAERKLAVVDLLRERRQWGSSFTHVDVSAPDAPALAP